MRDIRSLPSGGFLCLYQTHMVDVPEDKLFAMHLDESFLLPFVEYVGDVETRVVKQMGKMLHLNL